MISRDELTEIGKFQRTHALKGELNAILDIDPQYVEDSNPLVVNFNGAYVPFYAESIREKGLTSFLIKLNGVDSESEAKEFVNHEIYAPDNLLDNYSEEPEDDNVVYLDNLIGYEMEVEGKGIIGEIIDFDDSTKNLLFIVGTPHDERIYVPAVEEFIRSIDNENKRIKMDLPEGIIDLNLKED